MAQSGKSKAEEQAAAEQQLAASEASEEAATEQREIVEDELALAEDAEARRVREQERVLNLKSYDAEAELPPTQRTRQNGDVAYSLDRLTAESNEFLGHPPHVMAGALFGCDKEYLTLKEAEKLVDTFLNTESFTHPVGGTSVEA